MDSRVKLLRKQLNISQEAFGLKLGVTGAGISKIENGQRNLTEQMIILICNEYSINERWLRYGEGEMFKEKLDFGIEQIAAIYDLDDLDIKIIQEYVKLNSKNRKVIKEYIMRIAELDHKVYESSQKHSKDNKDNKDSSIISHYLNKEGNIESNIESNKESDKVNNKEVHSLKLLRDGKKTNEVLQCAEQD